jgi:Tol biopolymer transport system component
MSKTQFLKKWRTAKSGLPLFALSTTFMLCGCMDKYYDCVRQGTLTLRTGAVVSLTTGSGNDTEAACSPDGSQIAFQRERKGDIDIMALDLKSGDVAALVAGPGHACYPAWTPAGGLLYSYGNRSQTARQSEVAGSDKGFGLRILKNGSTQVLTQGWWRDYTPSVSTDGTTVYYTSTRTNTGNNSSLWKLPLADGAKATCLLYMDSRNEGGVQPSLSSDGRVLLWSELNGFYDNWRLCAALSDDPSNSVYLTPADMSAYAPRWSPDGRLISFTGFRKGDPGWRIYLMEPRSGAMIPLDTGTGNARAPAWSPDGSNIVYEDNSSGSYKLYKIRVKYTLTPSVEQAETTVQPSRVEGHLTIKGEKSLWVDRDGKENAGKHPAGIKNINQVPGTSPVLMDVSSGLNYGVETFYVKVKFRLDRLEKDTRIAAVGQYEGNSRAWQVFVRPTGFVLFSSRDASGRFIGVSSEAPLRSGQIVTVMAVRDATGMLRMWVDGVLQANKATGADFDYVKPVKIGLGVQYDGKMPLNGRVFEFETGRGWAPGVNPPLQRQDLFKEVSP